MTDSSTEIAVVRACANQPGDKSPGYKMRPVNGALSETVSAEEALVAKGVELVDALNRYM